VGRVAELTYLGSLGCLNTLMHTGVTGQIRKTHVGRLVLFHINTGLFWIYGILTFWLTFSVSGFWLQDVVLRLFLSLVPALIAAFTFAQIVRRIFWERFQSAWIHNWVIFTFIPAILLVSYGRDVQSGRDDALYQLGIHAAIVFIACLMSYARGKKAA